MAVKFKQQSTMRLCRELLWRIVFFSCFVSNCVYVCRPTYVVYVSQNSVYVRACRVHYHKRGNRQGKEQERIVVERRLTMFKTLI